MAADAAPRPTRPALRKRLLRVVREAGSFRLAASLLIIIAAVGIARYSWQLPLAADAERALFDIRAMVTAPHVDQDQRILMVVYTDETLEKTRKRSPLDRTILANALTNLDRMGAKAIGIDIIIDQPQPEDPTLVAAFRTMRTPTYLAYASNESNRRFIKLWQERFLARFQHAIATSVVKPTSILFETDPDRVVRRWPVQPTNLPPLMARAVTGDRDGFADYRRAIRFRLPATADRPVFASLPIDLFADPATASMMASEVKGRYVLIGGDLLDLDQFETPMKRVTGETTIGLEVHAHMLAQLLDGYRFGAIPRGGTWAIALLVAIAGGLSALSEARTGKLVALFGLQAVFFFVLPFYLQWIGVDTQNLPAFGWGVGWLFAYAAVGTAARAIGSEQRRFAQSALGRYLPRDIANEIMLDPDRLALHGEKRDIFVVFTDLEGFTKLSHGIAPEMVAFLLNSYLSLLSEVVLRHGGTIDKFVGDAVVAFWGAPIARPDDGERAARAAWAMHEAGEIFRKTVPEGVPPIGCTRVGLHYGEAIVGNFGGEGRIQYTALGDSMNVAARLEAANKPLHSKMLASKIAADRSGLDWWRPLGRVTLRGRSTPVEVFEPVPHATADDRTTLARLVRRFDEGDPDVLSRLDDLASADEDDAALANLVYRLHGMEREVAMFLGRKQAMAAGIVTLAAIGCAGAAVAGPIIVRSAGPSAGSYPPGKTLADDARITLRAGDQLVILDGRGTRTISGPGAFSASSSAAKVGATATALRILSTQGAPERRGGAVRGGSVSGATRSPNLWFVDVGRSSTICVADPAAVKLWRADASKPAAIKLTGPAGSGAVAMAGGAATADWPAALPVSDGAEYSIAGAGAPTKIKLVLLGPNPEGLEDTAAKLIAKGCTAQLDLLIDTVALPGDSAS